MLEKPNKNAQLLKRDFQPTFPHGLKVSKNQELLIIDFLKSSTESPDCDHSFSSIVLNKKQVDNLIEILMSADNK